MNYLSDYGYDDDYNDDDYDGDDSGADAAGSSDESPAESNCFTTYEDCLARSGDWAEQMDCTIDWLRCLGDHDRAASLETERDERLAEEEDYEEEDYEEV